VHAPAARPCVCRRAKGVRGGVLTPRRAATQATTTASRARMLRSSSSSSAEEDDDEADPAAVAHARHVEKANALRRMLSGPSILRAPPPQAASSSSSGRALGKVRVLRRGGAAAAGSGGSLSSQGSSVSFSDDCGQPLSTDLEQGPRSVDGFMPREPQQPAGGGGQAAAACTTTAGGKPGGASPTLTEEEEGGAAAIATTLAPRTVFGVTQKVVRSASKVCELAVVRWQPISITHAAHCTSYYHNDTNMNVYNIITIIITIIIIILYYIIC
jgi:hypothetical protein